MTHFAVLSLLEPLSFSSFHKTKVMSTYCLQTQRFQEKKLRKWSSVANFFVSKGHFGTLNFAK